MLSRILDLVGVGSRRRGPARLTQRDLQEMTPEPLGSARTRRTTSGFLAAVSAAWLVVVLGGPEVTASPGGAAVGDGVRRGEAGQATGSPVKGRYAFIRTQTSDADRPVTWDPCRPIEYYVNDAQQPFGAGVLIDEAIEEITAASGLELRYLGSTDREPWREEWRLRPTPGPVVIAWTNRKQAPVLAGLTAGAAGSRFDRDERNDELYYVNGLMLLDAPDIRGMLVRPGGRAKARAVVIHELGHILGLLHVDDRDELMYPEYDRRTDLGPGDRAGLAALGSGTCAD